MTGMPHILFTSIAILCLTACTQAGREKFARELCDSADNCAVYDETGRETSDRDFCKGSAYC